MSSSPSVSCDDILPIITDQFISNVVYIQSIDSAYRLDDAVQDMTNYTEVFPHMLRHMYRRLNSLGEALQKKRAEADRRAYNIAMGIDHDGEQPIVLAALELLELRCLAYLEPRLRQLLVRQGCGRCSSCASEKPRVSDRESCNVKTPGWNEPSLLILQ